MLWRLLSRLGRAGRLPGAGGGGGGEAAAGPRPRPEAPARPAEPPPPLQETRPRHGRGEHQQRQDGCGNLLRHCTSLDAFTWGVLAVLSLELAKQVKWLNSAQPSGRRARFCQLEGCLAVLPPHQHSVPPASASAPFSGEKKPHFFLGSDTGLEPENQSPSKTSWSEEYPVQSETEDCPSETSPKPASVSLHSQDSLEQQKSFREAASRVQQAFQTSISVAFNILGLEHLQKRQHAMAFSFFKLAADQNYSKAQFNVGLCYEHGRGTEKDMAKAVLYYQRAACQGHTMAQYRYAKWLLRCWPQVDEGSSIQEAVELLGQAAAAGLTQAQVYLGVLCLKGLKTGRQTTLKYSHVTAESEESLSEFALGICCEKDRGSPQNLWAAGKHNQEVEVAVSKPAHEQRTVTVQQESGIQSQHRVPVAPRPFFSSPCLQRLSQLPVSRAGRPVLDLIHSQSTGNLRDTACPLPPAFPHCFSLSLQPLAWSPGIAIG
ncbi:death ligand signal enhancer [Eublepharis macularius]|uniref:Death ligand signal enhancer n=1 Tax=Eublepharis macularius TaxID=481883 RepID=A0AA97L3I4_EUBMA|nr:death ligand signal enhancer [Eublepharis macularius]